jgi:hypothetical protein
VTVKTPDPDNVSDRIDARIKTSRYNRRALLLGAAGVGVVATVAGADPASAANGDALSLGFANSANDTTSITTATGIGLQASSSANGQSGIYGNDTSTAGGNGVYGQSTNGWGVSGYTTANNRSAVVGNDASVAGGFGVSGNSAEGTGVQGTCTDGPGVAGSSTNGNGVDGETFGADTAGVQGTDSSAGTTSSGVNGTSNGGNGVSGSSLSNHAVVGFTVGNGASGIYGNDGSTAGGNGVYGQSDHGWGVSGLTNANGRAGVVGNDESPNGGYGVKGGSNHGVGVYGVTTVAKGTGVLAQSTDASGRALAVEGVVTFTRSGLAKLAGSKAKPGSSVTVKNVALTATSIILVTPQSHVAGVAVAGVVKHVAAKSFTVYLTKPSHAALELGWFVIG